jgi:hypothetical protein
MGRAYLAGTQHANCGGSGDSGSKSRGGAIAATTSPAGGAPSSEVSKYGGKQVPRRQGERWCFRERRLEQSWSGFVVVLDWGLTTGTDGGGGVRGEAGDTVASSKRKDRGD